MSNILRSSFQLLVLLGISLIGSAVAEAIPTYVQGAYEDPEAASSVAVSLQTAQSAGDLNVVAIGYSDVTAQVTSVTDSAGNTYTLAVGPTVNAVNTQYLYYAKNIGSSSSNTITVVFNADVAYPDVRVAEYSGLDTTTPLDKTAGAVGSGTAASVGPVTTTSANELIVAATFFYATGAGSGTGYTQRLFTYPDTNLLEDRIVSATGSYSATSTQASADWWIMSMATFRAASGDTQAPAAPTNLSATAASNTQINLSWTASTDNVAVTGYRVERCQGAGCSTFAQIATPTGTTFSDTGLSASTSYSYRVRAQDATPNLSGYSNTATAATLPGADTQAPTTPTGLNVVAASSNEIDLVWTASTDNLAVTGYEVQRCQGASCTSFAAIATPTGASFNDTGLAQGTTYRYQVRARDAVPNWSATSSIVSATTTADTSAPTAPTGLTATVASSTQINLSWTASTDNVGVTGYHVERCQGSGCSTFTEIATPSGTTFSDTGRSASTSYSYRVRAQDAVPNLSGYSNTATATTSAPPDTQAPTTPTGLSIVAASSVEVDLVWGASTDNVGVTGYLVERCQGAGCSSWSSVATPTGLRLNNASLTPATSYSYRVSARDAAGNTSLPSTPVTYLTPANTPDCGP